jgi:hypothetical protein
MGVVYGFIVQYNDVMAKLDDSKELLEESNGGGGGELQAVMEELVCAVCMDTLCDPRFLHCMHTYCEKCLEGLKKASALENGVFCPECRGKTVLPSGGVKGEELCGLVGSKGWYGGRQI